MDLLNRTALALRSERVRRLSVELISREGAVLDRKHHQALQGRVQSLGKHPENASGSFDKPLTHNAYKVELAKRAIVRALMRASKLA